MYADKIWSALLPTNIPSQSRTVEVHFYLEIMGNLIPIRWKVFHRSLFIIKSFIKSISMYLLDLDLRGLKITYLSYSAATYLISTTYESPPQSKAHRK